MNKNSWRKNSAFCSYDILFAVIIYVSLTGVSDE